MVNWSVDIRERHIIVLLFKCYFSNIYSSKKETQNHIQKTKHKTTFKKRNAKPHIGDIGKIILIAVWQVTYQRSWSPTANSVCVLHVS